MSNADLMDDCITAHARYVAHMSAARQSQNVEIRTNLVREARAWFTYWEQAVERELDLRLRRYAYGEYWPFPRRR